MIRESQLEHTLCLFCAKIYEKDKFPLCPNCGSIGDDDLFGELELRAHEATQYGYNYRLVYEADLATGGVNSRYSIFALTQILEWIALAAISGIIGAVSWELTKLVIQKIKDQVIGVSELQDRNGLEILTDQEKLKQFLQYVEDYYHGMPFVHPEVLDAIMSELRVDMVMEMDNDPKYKELGAAKFYLAHSRIMKQLGKPISPDELKEIWKHIDMSG